MQPNLIGVVGLGFMGKGITACLLGHRLKVVGYDKSVEAQEHARRYIQRAIGELVEHAGFDQRMIVEWRDRYTAAESLQDLANCNFIIESVFEDIQVKLQVYDELESIVSRSSPIASNTSAIPISQL